jgi:L-threonylcarbamoyladenylate synthase
LKLFKLRANLMIISGNNPAQVQQAADALCAGELLGLPTETVYGLAADASNETAVAKIFKAKGRPANHPLIVHVASSNSVHQFASAVPDFAQKLMTQFWPGPLTLILPRREEMAKAAAGGQDSVGLRCPSHPVALEVLKACAAQGVWGVAAPSANLFGRVSPTSAVHVQSEFGPELLILDGGECEVGIESTIVDCTRGVPVLLRPGQISRTQIEQACGLKLVSPEALHSEAPRASGTLESHYAPTAKVRLMSSAEWQKALLALGPHTQNLALWSVQKPSPELMGAGLFWRAMPSNATQAAHDLFSVLRNFDSRGVRTIWIETPPETPEWEGVRDRLNRAAA